MATKKPAASTLLKNANAEIEKLQKQLKDKEHSYKYASDARAAAEAELEHVHAFLDTLPNVPPKTDKDTYKSVSAMTRIAAWLAAK